MNEHKPRSWKNALLGAASGCIIAFMIYGVLTNYFTTQSYQGSGALFRAAGVGAVLGAFLGYFVGNRPLPQVLWGPLKGACWAVAGTVLVLYFLGTVNNVDMGGRTNLPWVILVIGLATVIGGTVGAIVLRPPPSPGLPDVDLSSFHTEKTAAPAEDEHVVPARHEVGGQHGNVRVEEDRRSVDQDSARGETP